MFTYQDLDGKIIDPFIQKEIQYSTPCYALSCAVILKKSLQNGDATILERIFEASEKDQILFQKLLK